MKEILIVALITLILAIIYLINKIRNIKKEFSYTQYELSVVRDAIHTQYDSLPDEFYDEAGKQFIRSVDRYRLSWYQEASEDDVKKAKCSMQYYAYDGDWYSLCNGSMGEIVYQPVDEVPLSMRSPSSML